MTRWAGIVCLTAFVVSGLSRARAEDAYLFTRRIETDFIGSRSQFDGSANAKVVLVHGLDTVEAEATAAIRGQGGRVVATSQTIEGIDEDHDILSVPVSGPLVRDGRHRLYRRRGRVDILFVSAEAPVGPIARANALHTSSQLALRVTARDAEDRIAGRSEVVYASVLELDRLRRDPVGAENTPVGAQLRRAWAAAVAEAPTGAERDPVPVVEVHASGLVSVDGKHRVAEPSRLSPREADLVLGRRVPFVERLRRFASRTRAAIGAGKAPASATPGLAGALPR